MDAATKRWPALTSSGQNAREVDVLDIDSIAVGPYCVIDTFYHSRAARHPLSDLFQARSKDIEKAMDNPVTAGDQYGSTQAPWISDDMTSAAWDSWMQWDGTEQSAPMKSMNPRGSFIPTSLDQAISTTQAQSSQTFAMDCPNPTTTSNPITSFGQSLHSPQAFDFQASMSAPTMPTAATTTAPFADDPIWASSEALQNSMSPPSSMTFPEAEAISAPQYSQVSPQSRSLSTPSLQHSPQGRRSSSRSETSSRPSTPEPTSEPPKSRKRKTPEDQDSSDNKMDKSQPVKKTAHNMIEKRYRNNLNDKIAALRDSVPSLRVMSRASSGKDGEETEDLEGLTPAHKLNKATVLSKATEYIRHLEKRNKRLSDEMAALRARLDTYDRLATTAPLTFNPSMAGTPGSHHFGEDAFSPKSGAPPTSQVPQAAPQGMIPLPESMINLHRAAMNQAHYAKQQAGYSQYAGQSEHPNGMPQEGAGAGRGYPFMNKLIVGSLAGIMVLEGLSTSESSTEGTEARGLMALPMQLLRFPDTFTAFGGSSTTYLSLAKCILAFTAILYLLSPLLDFRPKPKTKKPPAVRLTPAPSLASPVEVRQKAWLTAIQTVWVPRHNFFLEVAALTLKMLKLSARKLIGWDRYAFITGVTQEQELARVKAWEIALDSQLTGGDAEISKGRLVLTLMASGTLPDTPARLMLKALHIRVLLWEVANAGHGAWYMFEELGAKLARSYWNAARAEAATLNGLDANASERDAALPDHLAALLEQSCDDVLVPAIVKRAYDLAWNKPRDRASTLVDDPMNSVVEDFAISSPLDALSAWWSSVVLNKALCTFLDPADLETSPADTAEPSSTIADHLELANRTAPLGSTAHTRALVARAILDHDNPRGAIAVALAALPTPPTTPSTEAPPPVVLNAISPTPVARDVRVALTLAKCLSLAEEASSAEARARAAAAVNARLVARPDELTLLSFVAAYTVLNVFVADAAMLGSCRDGLERLAGLLRVWIGGEKGDRVGLGEGVRGAVVERCIAVSRMLVGMEEKEAIEEDEIDAGYASLEEGDAPGVVEFEAAVAA